MNKKYIKKRKKETKLIYHINKYKKINKNNEKQILEIKKIDIMKHSIIILALPIHSFYPHFLFSYFK